MAKKKDDEQKKKGTSKKKVSPKKRAPAAKKKPSKKAPVKKKATLPKRRKKPRKELAPRVPATDGRKGAPKESAAEESEFSEDLIVFETSAEAGEAITITFTAPAAGTYQVICKVPGHFSAGMEGLLTVAGS